MGEAMQLRPLLTAIVAILTLPLSLRAQAAPPAPPADENVTVLGRGPVHEAFAEPTPKDPQASPVIPKQPPPPIKELPPAEKPANPNAEWIPGYWQWDVARNDFVWVSGVWRAPPPGRQWVPGYWHQTGTGFQWVPGLWAAAGQVETPSPAPPASLEVGPSAPAPDSNRTYVPGCWIDTNAGYAWRPGYWAPAYNDWVWNPSYYAWTPAGAVFVSGFWDRPLEARGLLFAPVAFNNAVEQNPDWYYTPTYAVNPAGLLDCLFYQPAWGNYYFGDYFNPSFASDYGFAPWWYNGGGYYDPLYSHYGWRHRFDRGWGGGLRNNYYARRGGSMSRPAVSVARGRGNGLVTPLNRVTGLRGLNAGQVQAHAQIARHYSALSQTRGQLESAARGLNGRYAASGARYSGYSGSVNPSRSMAAYRGFAGSNRTFTSGLDSHSHTSAPSGGRGFSYRAPSMQSHASAAPHFSARSSGHAGSSHPGGHGGGHSGGHGGGHSGGGHGGGHHK